MSSFDSSFKKALAAVKRSRYDFGKPLAETLPIDPSFEHWIKQIDERAASRNWAMLPDNMQHDAVRAMAEEIKPHAKGIGAAKQLSRVHYFSELRHAMEMIAQEHARRVVAAKARTAGLPHYDAKHGYWTGGDTRTLYAFTDPRTGNVHVRPGGRPIDTGGPESAVRFATRAEGEEHWQKPLHKGWKVT